MAQSPSDYEAARKALIDELEGLNRRSTWLTNHLTDSYFKPAEIRAALERNHSKFESIMDQVMKLDKEQADGN